MTLADAVIAFIDKQKRLLRAVYDEAWQRGVSSYEPDQDPQDVPTLPLAMALTGLTGAALLAALRRYPYEAPTYPDAVRRAIALAPAFTGMNRMANELATLVSSPDPPQSLSDWAASNAYRLDGGDSVAWAGEQAGYAEAANADGQFLYSWVSEGDTRVCADCEILSGFPPMPLGEWPTSPGAGDTECSVGCRCTWDTWGVPPGPDYSPDLSPAQSELASSLAEQQAQTLTTMMPDVQYLN